jgi:glycosyltransferase involved in cell wall biosynthesis
MAAPFVSVIIPTYRRSAFLPQTLASVFEQTHADFEVIVVEDGSHEAADALAPYGDRITYLWQPNQGVGVARNTGAENARGDWLAFLDDDDLWQPRKLEVQLEAAAANPEAGLLHTDHLSLVDGNLRVPPRNPPRDRVPSGWICKELVLFSNFIVASSSLVKRTEFERVGGFTTNREWAEDFELWLRLSRVCKVQFVPAPLTIYRDHARSLSSELRWHFCHLNALEHFVRTDPLIWRECGAVALRRCINGVCWRGGYDHLMQEQFAGARRLFYAGWRWMPWDVRSALYATLSLAGPSGFRFARAVKRGLT